MATRFSSCLPFALLMAPDEIAASMAAKESASESEPLETADEARSAAGPALLFDRYKCQVPKN